MENDERVFVGQNVKSDPKVSILMPAYNVAQYIKEALDSVFNQTIQDFEVIVINDGSPDTVALEQVLTLYRDKIVYVAHNNRGLAGARNTGLDVARGEFVALLDPDDAWLPNYLEVQLEKIASDPTVDVVYPNAVIFGETPDAGKKLMDLSPSTGPVTVEGLISQKCTVMVSVLARKATLISAGSFDPSLRSSEDFDLWLRVLKSGGSVGFHDQVLVRYRRRMDSLSADPIWMNRHILKVLAKFEQVPGLTDLEKLAVSLSKLKFQADLDINEAKAALDCGDHRTAVRKLERANSVLDRKKITFFISILRVVPGLACRLYQWSNGRNASALNS